MHTIHIYIYSYMHDLLCFPYLFPAFMMTFLLPTDKYFERKTWLFTKNVKLDFNF